MLIRTFANAGASDLSISIDLDASVDASVYDPMHGKGMLNSQARRG